MLKLLVKVGTGLGIAAAGAYAVRKKMESRNSAVTPSVASATSELLHADEPKIASSWWSQITPAPKRKRRFGWVAAGVVTVVGIALAGTVKHGGLKVFAPAAAKIGLGTLFGVGAACAAFYKHSETTLPAGATQRGRFSLLKAECELEQSHAK